MRKLVSFVLLLSLVVLSARAAEDTIRIPKSRLEELERKAAELDKLKATPTNQPPVRPDAEKASISAPASTAETQSNQVSTAVLATATYPPIDTLPQLKPNELVDAGMLAAHFKQDPSAAAQRYSGRKLKLNGVISAFDKPIVTRNYKVVLRAAGSDLPVVCDFWPAKEYRAVFTANEGTTLVATLQSQARVTLARVGQTVTIEGECRGGKGNSVRMAGCHFVKPDKGL